MDNSQPNPEIDLVSTDKAGKFAYWMMQNRDALLGYLFSLHPHADELDDLLQETSLTLWKKIDEYDEQREFLPWALRIAYFEVLRWRKHMRKRRFVLSQEVVDCISDRNAAEVALREARSSALERCLGKLPETLYQVVEQRYGSDGTLRDLAVKWGKSTHQVYRLLDKARRMLASCIEGELQKENS